MGSANAEMIKLLMQGYSREEIALHLGIQTDSLRIKIHKARKRLKKLYYERR